MYRAVDKSGNTIDFFLTARRYERAARRFLEKAIGAFDKPDKITIDKSGANIAAIIGYNKDTKSKIEIRQIKYLNNIVEQDHCAVKRITRPMLGFKSFWYATNTLAGIELIHMIRKVQMAQNSGLPLHQQFDSLAA